MLRMLNFRAAVDEDVVHISRNIDANAVAEDMVNESLETRRGSRETERGDKPFKEAKPCAEGCLPFVSLLNPEIVKSFLDIKLREPLSSLELIL